MGWNGHDSEVLVLSKCDNISNSSICGKLFLLSCIVRFGSMVSSSSSPVKHKRLYAQCLKIEYVDVIFNQPLKALSRSANEATEAIEAKKSRVPECGVLCDQ